MTENDKCPDLAIHGALSEPIEDPDAFTIMDVGVPVLLGRSTHGRVWQHIKEPSIPPGGTEAWVRNRMEEVARELKERDNAKSASRQGAQQDTNERQQSTTPKPTTPKSSVSSRRNRTPF